MDSLSIRKSQSALENFRSTKPSLRRSWANLRVRGPSRSQEICSQTKFPKLDACKKKDLEPVLKFQCSAMRHQGLQRVMVIDNMLVEKIKSELRINTKAKQLHYSERRLGKKPEIRKVEESQADSRKKEKSRNRRIQIKLNLKRKGEKGFKADPEGWKEGSFQERSKFFEQIYPLANI